MPAGELPVTSTVGKTRDRVLGLGDSGAHDGRGGATFSLRESVLRWCSLSRVLVVMCASGEYGAGGVTFALGGGVDDIGVPMSGRNRCIVRRVSSADATGVRWRRRAARGVGVPDDFLSSSSSSIVAGTGGGTMFQAPRRSVDERRAFFFFAAPSLSWSEADDAS